MDDTTTDRAEQVRVSRPRLAWVDTRGKQDRLLTATSVCGSSESAEVRVEDRSVSRIHAELEVRPDGLWVRDLGSRNGTFIDRVRVERARVPAGGVLRLGDLDCAVTYEEGIGPNAWPYEAFGPLLGTSETMRQLFGALARAAATASSVLVLGETGTGKELVARALHEASPRASGPFVVVDCAALPETLLDAELFGHARGAFTGAVGARAGAFEAASGGTLFLDEIGELPIAMQPKLLRALEARTVRRLGETDHRAVDVRIVAATHRDLGRMAACGAFREDLFFRLSVLPIRVPALRERPTDIGLLLDHFVHRSAQSMFAKEQLDRLQRFPWLGNVRELRNFAERALAFGPAVALDMIDAERTSAPPLPSSGIPVGPPDADPNAESYAAFRERWIDHGEATYVRRLLVAHDGNVANAARAAGIARAHVYRLVKKHGL